MRSRRARPGRRRWRGRARRSFGFAGVQLQGADGVVFAEQPERQHAADPGLGDRPAAKPRPAVVGVEIVDQVGLVLDDAVQTRPLPFLVLDQVDLCSGISAVAATVVIRPGRAMIEMDAWSHPAIVRTAAAATRCRDCSGPASACSRLAMSTRLTARLDGGVHRHDSTLAALASFGSPTRWARHAHKPSRLRAVTAPRSGRSTESDRTARPRATQRRPFGL